jgi:nitrite reductase/ring-hydroxylating ferredoxin subunit
LRRKTAGTDIFEGRTGGRDPILCLLRLSDRTARCMVAGARVAPHGSDASPVDGDRLARQGPLNEETLDGSTVTCPWHGTQFNVCTGAVLRGPAKDPLKTYRVTVDGEVGSVDVPLTHAVPRRVTLVASWQDLEAVIFESLEQLAGTLPSHNEVCRVLDHK